MTSYRAQTLAQVMEPAIMGPVLAPRVGAKATVVRVSAKDAERMVSATGMVLASATKDGQGARVQSRFVP